MSPDFCALILTHGRPDNVRTYDTLKASGYTGRILLVVDDEDRTLPEYQRKFPGEVVVFSKSEIAAAFDEADNRDDRRTIFYARNACFSIARREGFKHFIQLDDDYTGFFLRFNSRREYGNTHKVRMLDAIFEVLLDFFRTTPILAVALSQGGDHIGGNQLSVRMRRKAMNSFICSVDRPFQFVGRVNEDVNTYVAEGRRGGLFFTVMQTQLNQLATQSNAGGMTDIYKDSGTYQKSFYSVIVAPSCVRIGVLGDPRSPSYRLHHDVNWETAVPKILEQKYSKVAR